MSASRVGAADPVEISRRVAAQLDARLEQVRLAKQPDVHGITIEMLDKMVGVLAEGLATGSTDMRALLYCAYREARKLEPKPEE